MSTVHTRPYLGRCRDCDYAISVLPEQITAGENMKDVKAGEAPKRLGEYGVFARCPNRHVVFRLKQIKGTYSPGRKCDSRCTKAKGDECTCSCGGMNHGRGYAIEVMTLPVSPSAPIGPEPEPRQSAPRPVKPTEDRGSWRDQPMSEAQRRKIDFELGRRKMDPEKRIEARRQFDNSSNWTRGKASDWISKLETLDLI